MELASNILGQKPLSPWESAGNLHKTGGSVSIKSFRTAVSISFHWVTNQLPNSGLKQQICVYFPVAQMGNLSSLRLFSGSIVVSALLGWSPPQVSAGNPAWLV